MQTNEPIKPGFYWAKLKYNADRLPVDLFVIDSNLHVWTLDKKEVWRDVNLFQIIAPALPPDQWPTENDLHDLTHGLNNRRFSDVEIGFRACYKLFTGKELKQ